MMPESETRSSLEDWPDGLWQGLSSSRSQPEGQHRGQNSSEGRQEASKGDPLVAYLEASRGDGPPQEVWPEASGGSRDGTPYFTPTQQSLGFLCLMNGQGQLI